MWSAAAYSQLRRWKIHLVYATGDLPSRTIDLIDLAFRATISENSPFQRASW
jgi:hypothetical protein